MSRAPRKTKPPGWVIPYGAGSVAAVVAVSYWATLYMAGATLGYALMVAGLLLRRQKGPHVALMVAAITLDLGIVLALELQREAIKTALSFTMTALQQTHVFCSATAAGLYFPVLVLGWMRFTGRARRPASRAWHIRLGLTAFVLRTLGFVLMFSLLKEP
jgi:hypothetical protein